MPCRRMRWCSKQSRVPPAPTSLTGDAVAYCLSVSPRAQFIHGVRGRTPRDKMLPLSSAPSSLQAFVVGPAFFASNPIPFMFLHSYTHNLMTFLINFLVLWRSPWSVAHRHILGDEEMERGGQVPFLSIAIVHEYFYFYKAWPAPQSAPLLVDDVALGWICRKGSDIWSDSWRQEALLRIYICGYM